MLTFVGIGLWSAKDVPVSGLEAIRAADEVFVEWYTARLGGAAAEDLAALYGRHVRVLGREEVEDGTVVMEAARRSNAVLLAVGDALTATTHQDLRLRAVREGVPTRVVHGASIVTAAPALLGLQNYKFGRTTTLVFPEPNYFPTSPYDVVKENLARGLHTLVLLDIRAHEERYMPAAQGAELLLRMERERGEGALAPGTLACAVARAGSPEPALVRGPLSAIAAADLGPPLHTLVVPGRLHFAEEEALEAFARRA
jgi:diphthine synthase